MGQVAAMVWCLAALLALQACATRGEQVGEQPAQQAVAVDPTDSRETPAPVAPPSGAQGAGSPAQHVNAGEFGRAMGGALVGATVGAGVSYLAVYSLGGPGLVSIVGAPIVKVGAVTGAVVGLAKAASHR